MVVDITGLQESGWHVGAADSFPTIATCVVVFQHRNGEWDACLACVEHDSKDNARWLIRDIDGEMIVCIVGDKYYDTDTVLSNGNWFWCQPPPL